MTTPDQSSTPEPTPVLAYDRSRRAPLEPFVRQMSIASLIYAAIEVVMSVVRVLVMLPRMSAMAGLTQVVTFLVATVLCVGGALAVRGERIGWLVVFSTGIALCIWSAFSLAVSVLSSLGEPYHFSYFAIRLMNALVSNLEHAMIPAFLVWFFGRTETRMAFVR